MTRDTKLTKISKELFRREIVAKRPINTKYDKGRRGKGGTLHLHR